MAQTVEEEAIHRHAGEESGGVADDQKEARLESGGHVGRVDEGLAEEYEGGECEVQAE